MIRKINPKDGSRHSNIPWEIQYNSTFQASETCSGKGWLNCHTTQVSPLVLTPKCQPESGLAAHKSQNNSSPLALFPYSLLSYHHSLNSFHQVCWFPRHAENGISFPWLSSSSLALPYKHLMTVSHINHTWINCTLPPFPSPTVFSLSLFTNSLFHQSLHHPNTQWHKYHKTLSNHCPFSFLRLLITYVCDHFAFKTMTLVFLLFIPSSLNPWGFFPTYSSPISMTLISVSLLGDIIRKCNCICSLLRAQKSRRPSLPLCKLKLHSAYLSLHAFILCSMTNPQFCFNCIFLKLQPISWWSHRLSFNLHLKHLSKNSQSG